MSQPRTAIVTGASRGIGRAIAEALGARGWSVAVNYHANADAAQQVVAAIQASGGKAIAVQADVAKAEDRQRLVERTIAELGPISLLVNNAGITSPDRARDLLDHREEAFDHLFATNLKGPYFLTQLVARHMLAAGNATATGPRCIINISSLSGYAVSTNRGDYCMAKAAMGMMTKVWAVRLAEHGIGVYEVRPGVIASDMTAPVKAKYDKLIQEEGLLPIARWGKPEDVSRAVVMLADGHLAYSTGETLNIDGGFHIRRL